MGRQWWEASHGMMAFSPEVHVYIDRKDNYLSRVVWGIKFIYVNRDGITVSSPIHGKELVETHKIKMDGKDDFFVGVEGFYAPFTSGNNMEAITSITFYSNYKRKYGPYGCELGTYFASISSAGKIVGFHGRSGQYLNAIGVHKEYN